MDDLRDRYLQGKLSDSERSAFEQGLSDEERVELAFELGIKEGLEEGFSKELRNKVASFEEKKPAKGTMKYAYISIAASVLVMASIVFYLLQDEASLFEDYYRPYPNYELTTVRGEEAESVRERAYQAYDSERYDIAIGYFSKMDSLSEADYFFRGICQIQVEDYQLALDDFDKLITLGNADYGDAAKWYAALVYLKLEKESELLPLLKDLSNGTSEYAKVSLELMNQL